MDPGSPNRIVMPPDATLLYLPIAIAAIVLVLPIYLFINPRLERWAERRRTKRKHARYAAFVKREARRERRRNAPPTRLDRLYRRIVTTSSRLRPILIRIDRRLRAVLAIVMRAIRTGWARVAGIVRPVIGRLPGRGVLKRRRRRRRSRYDG